jgi:hypothetical protein
MTRKSLERKSVLRPTDGSSCYGGQALRWLPLITIFQRDGVGRGLGVGAALGLVVGVAEGSGVIVVVGVGVGVDVGVGVGVMAWMYLMVA